MVGLKIAQNDKSRGERVSCFILREYRADGKQREFAQFSRALANGHIMLNTPVSTWMGDRLGTLGAVGITMF